MTDRTQADVVIVGDGPAGSALAAACAERRIDVVLVGPDEPWTATYSVWTDELDDVPYAATIDAVMAHGVRSHHIDRSYGVLDNQQLRTKLRAGVPFSRGEVESVKTGLTHHTVELSPPGTGPEGLNSLRCRLVVDATGWPPKLAPTARSRTAPAWQTAFGVVLPEPPDGDLGAPTLMDFRPAPDDGALPGSQPTFAYALPVDNGWLVEETVLAARPAIDADRLVGRLAARLDLEPDRLLADAVRTESVRIPMGGPAAARDQPIIGFGAAAGYVNPATGYSVAASLRAAGRVADAIGEALDAPADLVARWPGVWEAVWPLDLRRTRTLHDYGLELLTRLDAPSLREFFDRFFDLPVEIWAPYLRVDADPAEITRLMRHLFRSASRPMRRRLAAGNPLPLLRWFRP